VAKPRLLYIGDVPVEASYHGSALLHRLLSDYPPEKLCVVETATPSLIERRLADVEYLSYPIAKQRLLNTRFHPHAVAWFSRVAARSGARIGPLVEGFAVESVLTVAHGFGWLAAADFAAERGLPLHLMVHDDWPHVAHVRSAFRAWLDARFARVCRQAQSLLCVSPAMCAAYATRYGVSAEVIYPIRALDCARFEASPTRVKQDGPFTIAFAGSINSNGYIQALLALQEALNSIGGRLLIFGPLSVDEARQCGLSEPHTMVRGLLSATELLARLREEADTLFVPMSFAPEDRTNMELAFPSKLTDCTAVGLPLLIYGPPYSSAVAWARDNIGVAEVVETDESTDLSGAVARLATDPARRLALANRALEVGRRYFSHDAVQEIFDRAITSAPALQLRRGGALPPS
jgi:glycosyltransferase involved in cell wall biosynthesis